MQTPIRQLLSQDEPFICFVHRAGNCLERSVALHRAAAPDGIASRRRRWYWGVEADVKWQRHDEGVRFYLHHGLTGLGLLSVRQQERERQAGRLALLEDLARLEQLYLLLELKTGDCPLREALPALRDELDATGLRSRTILASGTLLDLVEARAVMPDVPRMLFSIYVSPRGRLLQLPRFALPPASPFVALNELGASDFVSNTSPLRANSPQTLTHWETQLRASPATYVPGGFDAPSIVELSLDEGYRGVFYYGQPQSLPAYRR